MDAGGRFLRTHRSFPNDPVGGIAVTIRPGELTVSDTLMRRMTTEADTCRKYVVPKLYEAGWSDEQISEQVTYTQGRIRVAGGKAKRATPRRVDYLLRYKRDYPIAVVEAKADYHAPSEGLAQAIQYGIALDVPFVYATNGHGIIEHDFLTGQERELETFPSPTELWNRLRVHKGLEPAVEDKLLTPYNLQDRVPRYYQSIAINRASEAILRGESRVLLTLATGTGKTAIAFQIAWRLWQSRWNVPNESRRPRILFLADRDVLVRDPYRKDFAPFGEARHRIEGGVANTSREMYFATYQSIAEDESRPGLYKEYPSDFFDLIIVDEAHRGSATDGGSWQGILEYFSSAVKLGMTATPLRDDSRDTYAFYGTPVYTYTLAQGIQDGFLAPYQVRRVVSDADATGFRPHPGMRDAFGREIPDGEYGTRDFETAVSLLPRTEAVAKHLVAYLEKTNMMDKTIVFCVDQDHARDMRDAIAKLIPDLMRQYPNYVCRVTADDAEVGKGHLYDFQDNDKPAPVILTTSRLLSTGVDAPMVKNVVLFRVVGTMSEFKQIIGRGTRVFEEYGKLFFTIIDYTGSATEKFADPEFDGLPAGVTNLGMTDDGDTTPDSETTTTTEDHLEDELEDAGVRIVTGNHSTVPRKYVVRNGVTVTIAHEMVQELDASGKLLRTVEFTKYAGEQVSSLFRDPEDLRLKWVNAQERAQILRALEDHGVALEHLLAVTSGEDSDPFDLLCHVAFGAPMLTRRQRAEAAKKKVQSLFQTHGKTALAILEELLERYAVDGVEEISDTRVFKLLPSTKHLNALEVAKHFGGAGKLREVLEKLQETIFA
jgi:type I restriction enzyme, R subunit